MLGVFSAVRRTGVRSVMARSAFMRAYTAGVDKQAILEQWRDQIKQKKIIETDTISASQVNLLGNTIKSPVYHHNKLPSPGTVLPPAWHLIYFPPRVPEDELSFDGFEQDWKPPAPFTHRMWAGGELEWNKGNPLRVGQEVKMESKIRDIQFRAAGRRGDSVFVWVDKIISNEKGWALTESRCWVYVQATSPESEASPSEPKAPAPSPKKTSTSNELTKDADYTYSFLPTPKTLFRFSALTFNSHLIHYDHVYATTQEHHRGCLVHGPMSFMMMVDQLNNHLQKTNSGKTITSFDYRCRAPLIVNEQLTVGGKARQDEPGVYDLWIVDQQGTVAVKGKAVVA